MNSSFSFNNGNAINKSDIHQGSSLDQSFLYNIQQQYYINQTSQISSCLTQSQLPQLTEQLQQLFLLDVKKSRVLLQKFEISMMVKEFEDFLQNYEDKEKNKKVLGRLPVLGCMIQSISQLFSKKLVFLNEDVENLKKKLDGLFMRQIRKKQESEEEDEKQIKNDKQTKRQKKIQNLRGRDDLLENENELVQEKMEILNLEAEEEDFDQINNKFQLLDDFQQNVYVKQNQKEFLNNVMLEQDDFDFNLRLEKSQQQSLINYQDEEDQFDFENHKQLIEKNKQTTTDLFRSSDWEAFLAFQDNQFQDSQDSQDSQKTQKIQNRNVLQKTKKVQNKRLRLIEKAIYLKEDLIYETKQDLEEKKQKIDFEDFVNQKNYLLEEIKQIEDFFIHQIIVENNSSTNPYLNSGLPYLRGENENENNLVDEIYSQPEFNNNLFLQDDFQSSKSSSDFRKQFQSVFGSSDNKSQQSGFNQVNNFQNNYQHPSDIITEQITGEDFSNTADIILRQRLPYSAKELENQINKKFNQNPNIKYLNFNQQFSNQSNQKLKAKQFYDLLLISSIENCNINLKQNEPLTFSDILVLKTKEKNQINKK